MGVQALRRLLAAVPLLLAASFIVFAVVTSFPGDPCRVRLGPRPSPEAMAACREELKLDEPFLARYAAFVGGAVRLDFGRDFLTDEEVRPVMLERLSATIELSFAALLLAAAIGLVVGTLSALRPGSLVDALAQVLSLGGVSIPVFWLGMMLIALFGGVLPFSGWTPSKIGPDVEYRTAFLFTESLLRFRFDAAARALDHLILPAAALATIPLATITRMTRSSVLEEIRKDYVTTARAKGVPEPRVIFRHVLRNALVPIVTITGLQLGVLLSGAVLTETVFSWPGLGTYLVQGATQRNYPVITGCMMLFVAVFVVLNLLVDLLYTWTDPRLRETAS